MKPELENINDAEDDKRSRDLVHGELGCAET